MRPGVACVLSENWSKARSADGHSRVGGQNGERFCVCTGNGCGK